MIPRSEAFSRAIDIPVLERQLDALHRLAGQVRTGSYVGTGRAMNVDLGFQPSVLFILMQQTNTIATGAISVYIPSLIGLTYHINGNVWSSTGVTSLTQGIMTLGLNVTVNTANRTFTWVGMG